jgi:hypothetical protein
MTPLVLLLLLLSTSPSAQPAAAAPARKASAKTSAPATPAKDANQARVITLAPGTPQVFTVRTSPNQICAMTFPADFQGEVMCGSCTTEAGGSPTALFRLDALRSVRMLAIKPRAYARKVDMQPEAYRTVLQVPLKGFAPITIEVEYVENPKDADTSVVFVLPDKVRDEMASTRSAVEQEMTHELDKKVTAAFMRALAEPHACRSLSQYTRAEDLVVEAREVCWFGRRYFLRVSIENRGRDPVDVAGLSLSYGAKDPLTEATAERDLAIDHLEFKQSVDAVLAFELKEGEAAPRRYSVSLAERGGRGRNVTLAKIEP